MSLANKGCIVTGVTSGIGFAITRELSLPSLLCFGSPIMPAS